jgi:hypothetical protein
MLGLPQGQPTFARCNGDEFVHARMLAGAVARPFGLEPTTDNRQPTAQQDRSLAVEETVKVKIM